MDVIGHAQRSPSDLAAYLELHIEQGGTLECTHTDIGVVEGIVGIHWWEATPHDPGLAVIDTAAQQLSQHDVIDTLLARASRVRPRPRV